jgi:hypothetical protein
LQKLSLVIELWAMDQRKAILVVSAVILLILLIVGGTIFYLARVFNSNKSNAHVVTSSSSPVPVNQGDQVPSLQPNGTGVPAPTNRPQPTTAPANPPSNSSSGNVYTGANFTLRYPQNWGLLTCNNSQNIEFDPYNGAKSKVACDFSVKPITVLVNHSSCQGGTAEKINNIPLVKVVTRTSGEVDYQWCTQTNPTLDVTERVAADGSRATAPGDYSIQVEQIIGSFSPLGGS